MYDRTKRKSYWKPGNDIIKIGTGFGDSFRKSLISSIKISSNPAFKPQFRNVSSGFR